MRPALLYPSPAGARPRTSPARINVRLIAPRAAPTASLARPPDKLSKLKEDVKTGFVKTIFGDSPERKRADDDTRPSPSENPLANKGAEIEKAAIASNSPLKPTEVSKDKVGNMKRTQGHS